MLDLHEIVDISEDGMAIQCHPPLEADRSLNLCLDLAESAGHIYTTAQVIWSSASGRAGLRFSELAPVSLLRLREWLFLNAMVGAANAGVEIAPRATPSQHIPPRPNYSDTLAAVTAVQRQVEALGSDLAAALELISGRAQNLVRASGAAIALADSDPAFMICRASSGPDAPPVGARLHVGSGFSGECVKTGQLLRCNDSEVDPRVDRDSCRALGVRSILAVPVRVGEKSIGILEAFSPQPDFFTEDDSGVLQRFADTVLAAVNRAAQAENLPPLTAAAPVQRFAPSPGSVLFASAALDDKPAKDKGKTSDKESDGKTPGGISLPRSLLMLLIAAAAVIAMVLGYILAPLIQAKLHEHGQANPQTVLASSTAPAQGTSPTPGSPSVDTATFDQLQQMAQNGDAAAQNIVGLHYAIGEGVKIDEREAIRWFTKAAEQGNIPAQSKLGSIYFRGRDVPQDLNQAYFWMVLARANGDETAKVLAPLVGAHLTRDQVTSIELDADRWLQQHQAAAAKPRAGR